MRNEDTLILRINADDYFFGNIKNQYQFYPIFDDDVDIKLFRILYLLKMPLCFYKGWKKNIKKYKKVILFDYGWNEKVTAFIKKYNKNCEIHLFYYNKISNNNHFRMLNDKNIDAFWSFDPEDVNKYGLLYNSGMYSLQMVTNTKIKEVIYDVAFLGAAKNREKEILDIILTLQNQGININYKIIKCKADYVKYPEYINMIMEAECILDVTNEMQSGLTLRFMEALFFSKKIITNNADILNYDFYRKENVFILGVDDITKVKDFIRLPYNKEVEKFKEYYDFSAWIDRFKIECEVKKYDS